MLQESLAQLIGQVIIRDRKQISKAKMLFLLHDLLGVLYQDFLYKLSAQKNVCLGSLIVEF